MDATMGLDKFFKGKRVLITGASRGIGKGLVAKLHEYEAIIFAIARTPEGLETLKKEFPNIETRAVDLQNWEATRAVIEAIGPVHFLVNNAAVAELDSFLTIRPETFDKVFNTGLKSVINVSQIVASGMIKAGSGGSIVNVSSLAAKKAVPGLAVYCTAKAGLDMLTKCMAIELGPHQIRVNSVNPGSIETDMLKHLTTEYKAKYIPEGVEFDETAALEAAMGKAPLGKVIFEMSEMITLTLFVLSGMVSMIHGESILLDGGLACA